MILQVCKSFLKHQRRLKQESSRKGELGFSFWTTEAMLSNCCLVAKLALKITDVKIKDRCVSVWLGITGTINRYAGSHCNHNTQLLGYYWPLPYLLYHSCLQFNPWQLISVQPLSSNHSFLTSIHLDLIFCNFGKSNCCHGCKHLEEKNYLTNIQNSGCTLLLSRWFLAQSKNNYWCQH